MSVFLADFPPNLGSEVAAGQHYMMIDSYKSTNATASGGLGDHLSSISLYIPAGSLKTSFTGNYEAKEGAALKAAATQGGKNALEALMNFNFTSEAAAGVLTGVGDFFGVGATGFGAKLSQAADKTGFISAGGNTPNNYMALVYGGPNEFRQHTFDFKFFPKNEDESKRVREIIKEFKRGTLPRMSTGIDGGAASGKGLLDPFFKSPRQHTIKFMSGNLSENAYLFKIGKSVITNMVVNYDPQTTVGFHSNGAPVQIDMSLTFKEIAFQIEPDAESLRDMDLSGAVSQNQSSVQVREEFREQENNLAAQP